MVARTRLLYLATSDWIGGMERCVINLSREFTTWGWDVRSVFLETPRTAALLSWARTLGFPAESSSTLLSYFDRHTYRKMLELRRFVAGTRADIVHLHVGSNFLPLKDVFGIWLSGAHTRVASIHSAEPWHDGNRQARRKTRVAAALCDALVAHSSATRDVLLAAGVPERKIWLAPIGMRPPTATSREAARARLALPDSAFIVSTNGRLVEHKGGADLIAAVARLPAGGAAPLVLIGGDGPERARLVALGERLLPGRVRFLGHMSDHADLYAASDVFSMPSHDSRESFGMVFIEAAFHNVASIGTRVGGVAEAVLHEETGLLVPPHDVDRLSAALDRLRHDEPLRRRYGEAARARALREFTLDRMMARYREIYARVARRPLAVTDKS